MPGEIVDWIYAVNSNSPVPPVGGVHPSDPELAEEGVIDDMAWYAFGTLT